MQMQLTVSFFFQDYVASGKVAWSSQETLQAFESASWTVGDQVRAGAATLVMLSLASTFRSSYLVLVLVWVVYQTNPW